jgi:glycosyltransferase involved in cell wall biosynthesis
MQILHVYKDYFPVLGGIENYIKTLAEAHSKAGHQVSVLVCHPQARTEILEMNGVTVVKAGRIATVASMPLSLRQPLMLARTKADVIHVHSPYPLGEASAWGLRPRTPLVITYQSDVVRQKGWLRLYAPILRKVLKRADRILVTSPRYLETSDWLYPVKDRCTVVPLGVDTKRFDVADSPRSEPSELLFVGRLRYYKGLDTLLHAMTLLSPELCLRVVGSGPMLKQWRSLAVDLRIDDRVHFVGDVSDADLPGEYHRAALFVLPANARAEAFGMVLLEAMASGLPCVTTEVGTGTSWVVQDGKTGRVVPPQDPSALAEALQELLSDSERLREMGVAARERAVTQFSQERLVARVMSVYQSLL